MSRGSGMIVALAVVASACAGSAAAQGPAAQAVSGQEAAAKAPAADPNRLYRDSTLVVRDRFSDEIVGKGPDVVLIPGLMGSRAAWKDSAERLRRTHRVHLIQVAGFSGEPARANAEGEVLVPTAEALHAYLVAEKLTAAPLIGHSWGGTALLYLAQRRPTQIGPIMMVDTVPFLATMRGDVNATVESWKPTAIQLRDAMARGGASYAASAGGMAKIMVTSADNLSAVTDWAIRSDPSVVARAYYDDFMLDLRPGLAAMRTPMTLVYPVDSATGETGSAKQSLYARLWAASPGLTIRQIENARHYVMLDQPGAFAAAVEAFLAP